LKQTFQDDRLGGNTVNEEDQLRYQTLSQSLRFGFGFVHAIRTVVFLPKHVNWPNVKIMCGFRKKF